MAGTIICGVDGSVDSRAALGVAARLAARLGDRLVLAHAVEYGPVTYEAYSPLGGMAPRLDFAAVDAGLDQAERRVLTGLPAERLAELADEEDAELIVVGSRGHGALKAAFLGSVSNSLVGVARCPVLIVPPGASDAQ
jgi:nucleotide-binding universal stress UspA family protein